MRYLRLVFDGMQMSFGGPKIDGHVPTYDSPTTSMVAGLLGCALGIDRRDFERLSALQGSLRIASREDRRGRKRVEYQTVDLGQSHLSGGAWTTDGQLEHRGGASGEMIHIRRPHVIEDARFQVIVEVKAEGKNGAVSKAPSVVSVDDLAQALASPAHPLYLGRKGYFPNLPILGGIVEDESLLSALAHLPGPLSGVALRAWCPEGQSWAPFGTKVNTEVRYEHRSYTNQVHVGRSLVDHGMLVFGR